MKTFQEYNQINEKRSKEFDVSNIDILGTIAAPSLKKLVEASSFADKLKTTSIKRVTDKRVAANGKNIIVEIEFSDSSRESMRLRPTKVEIIS